MHAVANPRRGDQGVALLTAILITMLAMALSLVVYAVSSQTMSGTRTDQDRQLAVSAAEAGVDYTFGQLQNVAGTNFPCTEASTVQSKPQATRYDVAIAYFDANGVPITCAAGGLGTEPAAAVVTSTGSLAVGATPFTRRMQSEVKLSPVAPNGFSSAIYAGSGSMANRNDVLGNGGMSNADVYISGDLSCANHITYDGNLYIGGNLYFQNQCQANGNVYVHGNVYLSGSVLIKGDLTTWGNYTQSNPARIIGAIKAAGSVSPANCGTGSSCQSGATGLGDFANYQQTFPILDDDPTSLGAWTAQHYVIVDDSSQSCYASGHSNNRPTELLMNAGTAASRVLSDTVYIAPPNCAVNLQSNARLPHGLVIFDPAGFQVQNATVSSTVAGQQHYLYFIVPDHAGATGQINVSNRFATTTDIVSLLYSPNQITFANLNTFLGQVYSPQLVNLANNFTMQFVQVPVFGASNVNTAAVSHKVSIVYKREN